MKPINAIMIICLLTVYVTILPAQENHFLEGGFNYYYFDYNENVPSPLKSEETAWLPGWKLSYGSQGKESAFYTLITFEYTDAKTDYNGTTQEGASLTLTSSNKILAGEFDFGYSAMNIGGSKFSLTPYAGVAYRNWERKIGDTDPRGYRELYTWWDIPVGLRGGYEFTDRFKVSCDISARIMLGGQIKFDFGGSDPSLSSPTADLGSVVGWKMSVPVELMLFDPVTLEFVPWYESSSIGQSNTVIVMKNGDPYLQFYEPSSSTSQVGFVFGLKIGI